MFKRRQSETGATPSPAGGEATRGDSSTGEGAPGRTLARRASDQSAGRRMDLRDAGGPAVRTSSGSENEGRKLVVGQGIRLSGEIKKCEKLVVEGEVQANLKDCLTLEIAETGLFNGAAVVEEAEISGTFEGELTANGRLYVRSTGRILGTIRYADLEIERGGKIAGTVDVVEPEDLPEPEALAEADEPEDLEEAEDPEDDEEAPAETAAPARTNGAGKGGSDKADLRT